MSRLRDLRKQQRKPMEVLARMARCSVRHIWLWERWNIQPHREIAERIAQALGTSLTDLGYVETEEE